MSSISTYQVGILGTFEYRVFFIENSRNISPFHDIALQNNNFYNFICEIPRGTTHKLEISKDELFNPIKQDIKNGKLRYIHYTPYPFHYGAFPQTWEDPNFIFIETQLKGDDDPIDVVDISPQNRKTGDIAEVKILGCLAMIDDGETDWKILVIDKSSPINMLKDVPVNTLVMIREWFRNYKVPDGKPQNSFALNEEFQDETYTKQVVDHSHMLWANQFKLNKN